MKILLIGNCQLGVAKNIIEILCPSTDIKFIYSGEIVKDLDSHASSIRKEILERDLVFFSKNKIFNEFLTQSTLTIPAIVYTTEMQDCVYVGKENQIRSTLGIYHSFICLCSYLAGLTEEECLRSFNDHMYEKLGYYDLIDKGKEQLKKSLEYFGPAEELFEKLTHHGQLMHTINHPRLHVIQTLMKSLLKKTGISYRDIDVGKFMEDPLARQESFPMLIDPNTRKSFSHDELYFKKGGNQTLTFLSLKELISGSYAEYRKNSPSSLTTDRFKSRGVDYFIDLFQRETKRNSQLGRFTHPYKDLPDHCFWKRSVNRVPYQQLDPVVGGSLKISSEDRVATAGSCFAQHIAKRLQQNGFNYYVAEAAPIDMPEEAATRKGYGLFSSRYGNVYTTRQLLQLIDRAFGHFEPKLEYWERGDGSFVDPFRPQIEPDGFPCLDTLKENQQKHLHAVKTMFEELDIFVFTLGLTECWEFIEDGSVLPLAPGVAGGQMDSKKYSFRNFCKQEAQEDMESFLTKLTSVNPNAKVLLTVSPVPLMATYENRHVLVSSTVSKSVLRVVADEVSAAHKHVYYFPSYEIITGNFNRGKYFKEDLREVDESGVDHVMRLFMKHYTLNSEPNPNLSDLPNSMGERGEEENKNSAAILKEMESVSEIFCDEEALDNES